MSDAEWVVMRAVLPVPAWMDGRGGRPEGYCHRQLIDAIRYLVDNGVKWRNMPSDFPGSGSTLSSAAGVTTAWSVSSTTVFVSG
jgi:transposase